MGNYGFKGFSTSVRSNLSDQFGSTIDLTPGGIYSASSYYTGSGPEKAFDNVWGNNGQAWMSNAVNTNQWVQCRFNRRYCISRLDIRNGAPQSANRAAKDCKLEASMDGVNYTKIPAIGWSGGAVTLNGDEFTLANATGTNPDIQTILFSNAYSYEYYRIYCANNYGDAYLAIAEIEMKASQSILIIDLDQ